MSSHVTFEHGAHMVRCTSRLKAHFLEEMRLGVIEFVGNCRYVGQVRLGIEHRCCEINSIKLSIKRSAFTDLDLYLYSSKCYHCRLKLGPSLIGDSEVSNASNEMSLIR